MDTLVVIVTGANEGIGFHLTKSLLADGHCVAGLDRADENLRALAAAHPGCLLARGCDVTDETQIQAAVEAVLERWGRIDILVNNACLALFKPFEEKSIDETRREFEVNYFGYVRMIAAVLPHMKARRAGIIHNLSSGVGLTGFPGIYGYASTKGAIEALARTLALELSSYGIHVTIMHPPLTNNKSAAPLGIPAQAMDDPARVGRNLARRVRSTKPVIAADFRTAVYLFLAYRHPVFLGRLFAALAAKAKEGGSREETA